MAASRRAPVSPDADDVRALGALSSDAAGGVARMSGDVHRAVADRVFGALAGVGVPVAPVRIAHDLIAGGAYSATRSLTRAGLAVAGEAVAASRPRDARGLRAHPRGVAVQAALAGAWGDRLDGGALAPSLSLHVDDRRPITGRIVVLVHGLGETERSWRRPGYAERLADHGMTPVLARCNTGLPVATNGARLSDALERLVAGWPVDVDEIALVGHSMGGLVVRAACHCGATRPWARLVRCTVALGTPHEGAPLARAAAAAERALDALPETRPFAAPLRIRSAGIRDLERGLEAPFLPGADHRFVSASVTRDPEAPAGRLLGDLLVHRRSAWAQSTATERLRFDPGSYRHLGGATHFDLLGHPAIADLLVDWLVAPADGKVLRSQAE